MTATPLVAVRQWYRLAAFGIARGDLRFVFSTLESPQAFDLSIDPHQKQIILESLPVKERQVFQTLSSRHRIFQTCSNMSVICTSNDRGTQCPQRRFNFPSQEESRIRK